jgi:ABA4-like protein
VADAAVMTLVWAQVIAWDLFVGRWMYLDSRERDIHPLVMAPILVLTIMLSPIAVPLYLILRRFVGRAKDTTREPATRATVAA